MKDNLEELNKILFKQLRRIDECKGREELEYEVVRSKSASNMAKDIISVGQLYVDAKVKKSDILTGDSMPKMLE